MNLNINMFDRQTGWKYISLFLMLHKMFYDTIF